MRPAPLIILLSFLSVNAKALAWVEDAFPQDQTVARLGYEFLFQTEHSQRNFSNIHSIQMDLERHWPAVRLFVTNMGFHFGVGDKLPNSHFADDLRFGAQYQFHETGNLHGAIRFWTKLPNTDDATGLGTDETDFWFMIIQSLKLSEQWAVHATIGLGIIGAPNLHASQNDYQVIGGRLDWYPTSSLSFQLHLHGFSGFRENDDKLSVKLRSGHHWETWALFLELQAPLLTNLADYADPFDHTAWGSMLYGELNL